MNKRLIAVCAAAGLTLASAAWAERGDGPRADWKRPGNQPGGPPEGGLIGMVLDHPDAAKQAGVTEEQMAELKKIRAAGEKAGIQLRSNVDLARQEVRTLMDADTVDKKAVMEAVEKGGQAMTELRKAEIGQAIEARALLGKDTVAKLREALRKEMRADRRDRGQEKGEDRHGHHDKD